jgi:dCMP deaminase
MERVSWDSLYMSIAYLIAMRSPDPSTQVGSVVVAPDNTIVATGYNGWPRGVAPFAEHDPRWARPGKYFWMAHAERNAIDNAARAGVPLDGCTLYSLIMPCADCARGIIQVGIKRVICHESAMREFTSHMHDNQDWVKGLEATRQMFDEAGVVLEWWDGTIALPHIHLAGHSFIPQWRKPGLQSIGPISAEKFTEDCCAVV